MGMEVTTRAARNDSPLSFFALTYAISWAIWLPMAAASQGLIRFQVPPSISPVASFGPSLAALILTSLRGGRKGLRGLLGGALAWRVGLGWYIVALLGPPLVGVAAMMINHWLGGSAPVFPGPGQLAMVLPVFLFVFLLGGPLGEELGWRGYAQPLLQSRFRPLVTSLILGAVWGLWHLPLFWIEISVQSEIPLWGFMAQIVGNTFIYTWMYNGTGGSLLRAMLFHASGNTAAGFLPFLPLEQTGGETGTFLVFILLLWMVALAVTLPGRSTARRF
jgi:membrane protease YdiL (CAAX protease family)